MRKYIWGSVAFRVQKNPSSIIFALIFFLMASSVLRAQEQKKAAASTEEGKEGVGKEFQITNEYTHNWVRFWGFSGKIVGTDRMFEYTPHGNIATVVVFLASWDRPSQLLIHQILKLEEKYGTQHTKFIYVFSHDTHKDAGNFIDHMKMNDSTSIIANHKLLQQFKEPQLVTIYVADRHHWLASRYISVSREDLQHLDAFLRGINAM